MRPTGVGTTGRVRTTRRFSEHHHRPRCIGSCGLRKYVWPNHNWRHQCSSRRVYRGRIYSVRLLHTRLGSEQRTFV